MRYALNLIRLSLAINTFRSKMIISINMIHCGFLHISLLLRRIIQILGVKDRMGFKHFKRDEFKSALYKVNQKYSNALRKLSQ
jgi:hypothetical protein